MKVDIQKAPLGTIVYTVNCIDYSTTFDDKDATTFAGTVVEDSAGHRSVVSLRGGIKDDHSDCYATIVEAIDASIAEEQQYIEQTNSLIQRLNKFKERVANSPSTVPVPPPFEPSRS